MHSRTDKGAAPNKDPSNNRDGEAAACRHFTHQSRGGPQIEDTSRRAAARR